MEENYYSMALYDFTCPQCGKTKEKSLRMDKHMFHPKINCPSCKCEMIKKRFYEATPLHFKGTGFYETDYGKK